MPALQIVQIKPWLRVEYDAAGHLYVYVTYSKDNIKYMAQKEWQQS
jgi:hypothetical protein